MKLVEYISHDPHLNLAIDEYYFQKTDDSYIRLWQNHNTIVIGKNQNLYNEINLDVLDKYNVTASRRITGGGAVYHDLGNINFSFMTSDKDNDVNANKYDFKRFNEPVIRALRSFGVEASDRSRNDIVIEGKKISGSAQCLSNGRILHHGTLLIDSDLDFIGKCLTASGEKLGFNGVASVRSRVANINDFLEKRVTVDAVVDRLKEFFMQEFQDCRIISPDVKDMDAINTLKRDKYETRDWVYGTQPRYNFSVERRFEGCGGINVYLDVVAGTIVSCRIFGDFFGNGDIMDIEKLIVGQKHDCNAICATFGGVDIQHYFRNLRSEDFFGLFSE